MARRSASIWVSPGPPTKPSPPRWQQHAAANRVGAYRRVGGDSVYLTAAVNLNGDLVRPAVGGQGVFGPEGRLLGHAVLVIMCRHNSSPGKRQLTSVLAFAGN